MDMQIRQLQLILNAPVGPLNDVRKQRIAESIGSGFMPQQAPVPNALVLVNPMTHETLFITDNQIHYTIDGENVQFSAERFMDLMGGLRDVLLLDDRFPMMIQVIAHKDAKGSAIERTIDSLSPLPAATMRDRFDGLRGIGLRVTFEVQPYTTDFRIEPLFADPAFLYLQLNSAAQAPQSLGRIAEDVQEWLGYLAEDLSAITDEIMAE
jgi:hypothetical protein